MKHEAKEEDWIEKESIGLHFIPSDAGARGTGCAGGASGQLSDSAWSQPLRRMLGARPMQQSGASGANLCSRRALWIVRM